MTLPLAGRYIQVCTPSLSGTYSDIYLDSIMGIKTTLEHFGAIFQRIKYNGCSDLPHARAKILAGFTDHDLATDIILLDADMGIDPNDVVRLLTSNRDFVAGVGCKKKLPLEWCIGNHSDATGEVEPIMLKKTGDQLVAYPKAVGTGFVMMSKQCALRMRQAYPELMYIDRFDKKPCWALYDPVIIINGDFRARHFDDFAFCYRWRKIGGTVAVFPDIHMKHEGNYIFEGSYVESDEIKELLEMFDAEAAA